MSPLAGLPSPVGYSIAFHIFNILHVYIECQVFYGSN